MAVSRVFVRNLPPSITEEDFRAHFAKRFPATTDLKLFSKRRIGYVGLKTPEDAAAAVKYFNKSFIRMSRIHVELAKEPELAKSAPTSRRPLQVPENSNPAIPGKLEVSTSLKRKHDEPLSSEVEKKLKKDEATPIMTQESSVDFEPAQDQQESQAPASDMDWMRSKTSRLLGLGDVDEEDSDNIETISSRHVAGKHVSERDEEKNASSSASVSQEQRPEDPQEELYSTDQSCEQSILETGRLFLRNLPYTAQEEDLRRLLSHLGSLSEVHIPQDPRTGQAKGFAFVLFEKHEEAVQAYNELDGKSFQGRLMHIIPGAAKRDGKIDDFAISQLPLKKQKQLQRQAQSASSTFNWNSLYMNADAVVTSISDRLGIPKSELFDPTSANAAVKQAQAETHVIQETKTFFEHNGVDLNAFKKRERGDTAILVKNFPYGTKQDELRDLFAEFGEVKRVLLPPSGTIAIVEFSQRTQARAAFASLAYRKFKDSMLFLEKAPRDLFSSAAKPSSASMTVTTDGVTGKPSTTDLLTTAPGDETVDTSTLYVRNLNFATSNQKFEEAFKPLDGFLSARVKQKVNPKRPGEFLSMGFGFLEFQSAEQAGAAMHAMNGFTLDGHQLLIRASHKGNDAAEERRKEDKDKEQRARKSKIIIKNLPFEASKQDIRALFKSYGQLRSVRVPKKFDGSRKGFAFAEFTTPKEAENAMDALRNTHFLGRRLVLDYAAGEADDAEKEIAEMQKKVGRQTNSVALQKLTKGSERRKFTMGDADDQL